jgi:zinc protease
MTAPNVPFPAVAITYLAPTSKDADVPACASPKRFLSGGESSRLYQELVYKQQLAQEASFTPTFASIKACFIFTDRSEGKTAEALEKSLLAELKKFKTRRFPQRTRKSEKSIDYAKLQELETNDGKALAIERAVAYEGDPKGVNRDIAKLQAVTAADVQRVMKKYFTDTNRVVIYYQQGEGKNSK